MIIMAHHNMSTPTRDTFLFIICTHCGFVICCFKCFSTLKQDDSKLLSMFSWLISWIIVLKVIPGILLFLCVVFISCNVDSLNLERFLQLYLYGYSCCPWCEQALNQCFKKHKHKCTSKQREM